MFAAVAVATLLAVSQLARGTPVSVASTTMLNASFASMQDLAAARAAGVPIAAIGSSLSYVPTQLGSAPRDTVAAVLQLCSSSDCGNCQDFDLDANPPPFDECYSVSAFQTFQVAQSSGQGLPYGVLVGPDCDSLASITQVNQCYGLDGTTLNVFALFDV